MLVIIVSNRGGLADLIDKQKQIAYKRTFLLLVFQAKRNTQDIYV